jgi:Flp pilus assembly protein TadG
MARSRSSQSGQAIVLVALVMVVLFGFVGLAVDGGRGYLDRRQMQASVDAAALAAAYNYMNNSDYTQAEQAAVAIFATNERLYTLPTCSGYGTTSVSCTFGDATNQSLSITVANHAVAGVSFAVSANHHIPVAVMQVLGSGPAMTIATTATAVARKAGTNGAAIQTLSPGNCVGNGQSLVFTGTSTTTVTGDIWSNGSISDSGSANGSINGNVIDICPGMPPSPLPNFTVSGSQANGWTMPDPDFPEPPLNPANQTWNSTSGSVESPGTYGADPRLGGGAGCYFLAGGVYDFSAGFTQNGGFVSNELRPPDEPNLSANGQPNTTTLDGALTGSDLTSIAVNSLRGGFPSGSTIYIADQVFTTSRAASAGDRSISINRQSVSGSIPSGTLVAVRALPQFWDSNGVGCSSTFALSSPGSGNFAAGQYSVVVTAVQWSPNGVPSCSGPISPSCYLRESAPSLCKTLSVGSSGNLKVSVTNDPGAQDFNVYVAPNGSCSGMTFCTDTGTGGTNVTINSCPSGQAGPPDFQWMPQAVGLPNSNPPAATPPSGDLANEGHCVDPSTGSNSTCPGSFTPGAVTFFIPGGGTSSVCLNLQGGGDIYVFTGYQYQRILVYEPGPEQQPPANTCSNNVAGSGITSLIGIFYVPAASVTIVGSHSYLATIAGGVIAWTVSVKGNGGVSISVDPTLRTWPSAVRLTQ